MHPSCLSKLRVEFPGTSSLSYLHPRRERSERTVGIHGDRISAKHLWHSEGIRGNLLACLSAYVLRFLRTGPTLARVEGSCGSPRTMQFCGDEVWGDGGRFRPSIDHRLSHRTYHTKIGLDPA